MACTNIGQMSPGQKHRLQARDQVAGRHDDRDPLDDVGIESISNRKPDSRKAGRKAEISASCEARNWFFVAAEIRSPWPSAGIRKVARQRIERDDRAAERHVEDEDGEQHAESHRRQGRAGNREDLADKQLDRGDRRRHHRLHRAALPFAGDDEGCQEGADQRHDDGDGARHEEVAARQLGIEPEALFDRDRRQPSPCFPTGAAPPRWRPCPAHSSARNWRCWAPSRRR